MSVVAKWDCGAFVNSLHVYSDGSKVVSADAGGNILTWDTRTGGVVDSYSLEDPIHISHIQASPPDAGRQEEEGLLLAANCFDNTLRVFHRRFLNSKPPRPLPRRSSGRKSAAPTSGIAGGGGGGGNSGSSAAAAAGAGGAGSGDASSAGGPQNGESGKGGSAFAGRLGGEDDGGEPSLELMHALRGHTVKNWPIR
ncbi:unnamed protein product [Scytosiphon promiscuus]